MTESPFVKTEGPEPPDVVDFLGKEHQEAMAKVNATILDQIAKQSVFRVSNTSVPISVTDTSNGYAYYREQMQPDRAEIERVRAELYRSELALTRTRNNLARATDELNRVSNSLSRAEARVFDSYQLIAQLVGYLDSIEWGTHDEWTRSQSLRERAHEYLTASNTIAT